MLVREPTASAASETPMVAINTRSVPDAPPNGSVTGLTSRATLAPTLEFAMGDWFSLSVLQMFSIVCFVLLAVARIGSVHLGRLQHKFEANVQQPAATVAASVKIPLWSWKVSGLPVSFSLGSLLGEDEEQDEGKDGMVGYDGGSTLVRMDWQLSRPATVIPQPQFTQPPLSMAKLIMTRHLQRKPGRSLRRMQGTMRPPTRLSQSAVL